MFAWAATGRGFGGGWNNTGVGTGPPAHDVSLRELFVRARTVEGIDLEVGGLPLLRGESTEATSYDNDGYIVGERISLRRPAMRVLDEVSFTRAYLGDLQQPNVFARLDRLDTANYYQLLALKRIARSAVSADFSSDRGTYTVRGALNLDAGRTRIIDRFRVEAYARIDPSPGNGFALMVQRRLWTQTMLAGGLSSIDSNYGGLNGDLYGVGRRVFGSFSKRFGSAWLASAQIARMLGEGSPTSPRTRIDVALGYDLLGSWTMRRTTGNQFRPVSLGRGPKAGPREFPVAPGS